MAVYSYKPRVMQLGYEVGNITSTNATASPSNERITGRVRVGPSAAFISVVFPKHLLLVISD